MKNILSLFDGISCARLALDRANIEYDNYYASEIDKYALQVTAKQFPDNINLGDITKLTEDDLPSDVFLLIGGSPCTSLSCAAGQKESGLKKGESTLFWEYLRVLKLVKPKYFILENVASMKKADRDIITQEMGVEPIKINSSLVSGQQRSRLYWSNIEVREQPEDKNIHLKDILESGYTEKDKSYCLTATYDRACVRDYIGKSSRQLVFNKPIKVSCIGKCSQGSRVYSIDGKSVSLCANGGGRWAKTGLYEVLKGYARKLSPIECERL